MLPDFQGETVYPDEPMVLVEQVVDRPFKDDCRNYTSIVWNGQGDVQPYPERLWPKLAPHPDVWKIHVPTEAEIAAQQAQLAEAEARAAQARKDLEDAQKAAAGVLLSAEDLAAMSDEDVRAEGRSRKYQLHGNLASEKLRPTFLDVQASRQG